MNRNAIGACHHRSLAVTRDGTVFAWGRNDLGQVGDGSRQTMVDDPTLVYDEEMGCVAGISAGHDHSRR